MSETVSAEDIRNEEGSRFPRVLARLSTRGSGRKGTDTVELILGIGFKGNNLKPDTIYEIQEVLGVLSIVEVGPSAMREVEQPLNVWCCDLSQIVACYRERLLLTREEWLSRRKPVDA